LEMPNLTRVDLSLNPLSLDDQQTLDVVTKLLDRGVYIRNTFE
jgi:hypothetical protein